MFSICEATERRMARFFFLSWSILTMTLFSRFSSDRPGPLNTRTTSLPPARTFKVLPVSSAWTSWGNATIISVPLAINIPLVYVGQQPPTNAALLGIGMRENPLGRGNNDGSDVHARQIPFLELLKLVLRDGIPGLDGLALVYLAQQGNLVEAFPSVIHQLVRGNIAFLLHDPQDFAQQPGSRSYHAQPLGHPLMVLDVDEGIRQWVRSRHVPFHLYALIILLETNVQREVLEATPAQANAVLADQTLRVTAPPASLFLALSLAGFRPVQGLLLLDDFPLHHLFHFHSKPRCNKLHCLGLRNRVMPWNALLGQLPALDAVTRPFQGNQHVKAPDAKLRVILGPGQVNVLLDPETEVAVQVKVLRRQLVFPGLQRALQELDGPFIP